jgi:hypothetical protein
MNYIQEGDVNAISGISDPLATCTLDGITVNIRWCHCEHLQWLTKMLGVPGVQC